MLAAALISTVVGTRVPGPGAIYMSQNLRFTAPVKTGDTIKAVDMVRDVNVAKRHPALEKICQRGDEVVVTGGALLLVPTRAVFGGTSENRDE
jgi:3-hydroxybutyryl-CoA dehydratase